MIQIIAGLLFAVGLFLIFCDLLKIPKRKASKTMQSWKRQKKKALFSTIQKDLAAALSKLIHLNEYKRLQLAADLKAADLSITPEEYTAGAVIKAIPIALLIIPALFLFPLLTPFIVVLTVLIYFKEKQSVQKEIQKRRAAIEYELPRFVSIISETLKRDRNILTILDSYQLQAGTELKKELETTTAQMRSGNYELALTKLETRVGSPALSDVVRGLSAVLRGDDTTQYWTALELKFADIQRQNLLREAQKVPSKVRRLSFCLLACFVMTYFVVMGIQIFNSLGVMFAA